MVVVVCGVVVRSVSWYRVRNVIVMHIASQGGKKAHKIKHVGLVVGYTDGVCVALFLLPR